MKIYLIVMYDRHCDDQYGACRDLEFAKKVADQFMSQYGDRYKWEEQEVRDWLYYHVSNADDGPRVHIEELELG